MATRNTTQIAQPAGSTVTLPSRFPAMPDRLVRAFPDFKQYHHESERIYKAIREAIRNTSDDLAIPLQKSISDSYYASVNGYTAAILEESYARIEGDAAVAGTVATLSSTVGAHTAAITTLQTVYADITGFMEARWSLNVAAGNVVTGITLYSASGPDTNISEIIFQASTLKLYNGATGVQLFSVDGFGNISVAGSITLSNTQVSGLGALALLSSVSYGSITGTKPPTNADVTLSAINGGLAITGGGLQLLSGGAALRGGQTAYDTGLGFWLGDAAGTTKFSIGNSGGNKLTWNGSALAMVGSITSTSGSIGGWTLNATSLTATVGGVATTLSNAGSLYMIESGRTTLFDVSGTRMFSGGNPIFYLGRNASGHGELGLSNSSGTVKITGDGSTGTVAATSFNTVP